jgi:hypothetical protein
MRLDKLIAATWLAAPDAREAHELIHLDDDASNCAASNLRWRCLERREFKLPSVLPPPEAPKTPAGARNGRARLSEVQVAEIRKLLAEGTTCTEVARRFGVSRSTVSLIRSGRRWGGVR